MTEQEKWLLLQLILEDIRGNWGWNLGERVSKSLELAKDLKYQPTIDLINEFEYDDGRHFRCDFKYGGYAGMSIMHNLTRTISDKSEEFKSEAVGILTYPESSFDDWESFNSELEN